jgi:hypothetical protein
VDLTVNLFTSFGYFATDADHQRALGEMIAVIRPGGWFVIDFLNAAVVRSTVGESSPAVPGAARVDKWLHDDARFVVKSITAPDGRQFMERVRLFEPDELAAMIRAAGAVVRHRFGDYHGGPATPQSPRVMIFAQVQGR